MQRKDLALRVLSTAAIMSIVTSIAAPAFAGTYYIGNGSIDVKTMTGADGEYVQVTQNGKTYTDTSDEIVIKDGTSEKDATLKEAARAEGTQAKPAVAPAAGAATQELEAAGTADAAGPAAGESQLDPDDAFTLSEEEEDSEEGKDPTDNPTENPTENPTDNPTEKPTENPTDNPTEPPKEDVVYEYAPADPDSEQQATKLAPTTSAAPAAKTKEVTLAPAPAADPAPTTPAEGSAANPSKNVIRVINDWVGKVLNIRLSNVNIKQTYDSKYADGNKEEHKGCVSGMTVKGSGNTKMELDGQNVLDGTDVRGSAGLYKDNGDGWLTITDETDDKGKEITSAKTDGSGSLSAKASAGGNGGAAIGGVSGRDTKNIIIEGYATVNASGSNDGAGIGGGGWSSGCGNAENIIIRGHSNVTATACDGAAIGGGSAMGYGPSGSATGIQIYGHATVNASTDGNGAAIGAGGHCAYGTNAKVTIGTAGATAEQEDVHVTATSSYTGAAIGNGKANTTVIIQGHTTIENASSKYGTAIGGNYYPSDPSDPGDTSITTSITIRDNATIKKAEASNSEERPVIGASYTNKLVVNIEGNAHLGTVKGVIGTTGSGVKDAVINIKDNAHIDTIEGGINAIGGESGSGKNVTVNIDGGKNGNVRLDNVESGSKAAISGTKVNIGDNVLLKMRQSGGSTDAKYINVNNAEAEVGTRSNPAAGGLVNTIGDNTELWYLNEDNRPQKIVHGKNVCAHVPGKVVKKVDATCTEDGWVEYECNYEHEKGATGNSCGRTWKETIPATGHHWKDNGNGTHTCPDCGATEALPVNTNSALELRVVDAEGMNEPFTVSENGTLRTYTGAYDTATLTGDLNTLRYLQDHGAQTIQFVTNGQTSSFAINDLLAQGSGSEVFYLTHRGAEEPTLLLVEADHSELVKD
ncbi:MAG: PT domain-containing protein [Faecalibacterium longum]|nr:PT domain-containing protein [Faecalibacterium prausnitzii]MDY5550076.1 PT domain-containing protein [Faecalibacterium longum]